MFSRFECGLCKVALHEELFAVRRLAEIDANISADGKVDIYSPYIRHMLG